MKHAWVYTDGAFISRHDIGVVNSCILPRGDYLQRPLCLEFPRGTINGCEWPCRLFPGLLSDNRRVRDNVASTMAKKGSVVTHIQGTWFTMLAVVCTIVAIAIASAVWLEVFLGVVEWECIVMLERYVV